MSSSRLDTIRKIWQANADAYLVFKPEYIENRDIEYATGFRGGTAVLFQTRQKTYLITDPRYSGRNDGAHHGIHRITVRGASFTRELQRLVGRHVLRRIAVESYTPFGFVERLRTENPETAFSAIRGVIAHVRAIKTQREIELVRTAQAITDALFRWILRRVAKAPTERDLTQVIEREALRRGASLAFPSIVAFGKHTAIPHHEPTACRVSHCGPLLLDFGLRYKGYCSDLTRTVWVGKKPTVRFKHAYAVTLAAQEKAIAACRFRGTQSADAIDAAARSIIDASEFRGCFTHSAGHGVGMDVHEEPTLSSRAESIVQKNETVTIEPGIYLAGKFGIRIEDIVVTGSGTVLTHAPKQLIEVR